HMTWPEEELPRKATRHPSLNSSDVMPRFLQISAAAAQLVQYCQENRRGDPLLTGISASSNPFKDKKTCVLL
uniref:Guanine nucleotide-binding protein subunit gamma n=1 Tax=Astyanax mexicanus TaxID=7994 RepID=A0A8B9HSL7_ASTMX